METLNPSVSCMYDNLDWHRQGTEWTREENKEFERALAIYDENEPDRWRKVADMIPGKTVYDVIKQYRELEDDVSDIEAGKVSIPGYKNSSLEWVDHNNRNFDQYRKIRHLGAKTGDQERKKGVPWTEDEHKRFLLGLLKHGKGDWRNISKNFVVTKTPTQVASHAQKYFIRQQQHSGFKDKRRPSIHDITTFNLTHANPSSAVTGFDQSDAFLSQKLLIDGNQSKDESIMLSDPTDSSYRLSSSNEIASAGLSPYAISTHKI